MLALAGVSLSLKNYDEAVERPWDDLLPTEVAQEIKKAGFCVWLPASAFLPVHFSQKRLIHLFGLVRDFEILHPPN